MKWYHKAIVGLLVSTILLIMVTIAFGIWALCIKAIEFFFTILMYAL